MSLPLQSGIQKLNALKKKFSLRSRDNHPAISRPVLQSSTLPLTSRPSSLRTNTPGTVIASAENTQAVAYVSGIGRASSDSTRTFANLSGSARARALANARAGKAKERDNISYSSESVVFAIDAKDLSQASGNYFKALSSTSKSSGTTRTSVLLNRSNRISSMSIEAYKQKEVEVFKRAKRVFNKADKEEALLHKDLLNRRILRGDAKISQELTEDSKIRLRILKGSKTRSNRDERWLNNLVMKERADLTSKLKEVKSLTTTLQLELEETFDCSKHGTYGFGTMKDLIIAEEGNGISKSLIQNMKDDSL